MSLKNITVPWFVILFFGVVVLNSVNILGETAAAKMVELDNFLMTVAMAALGLETSFSSMRKVGVKPLYLGVVSSLFISVVSAGLLWWIL